MAQDQSNNSNLKSPEKAEQFLLLYSDSGHIETVKYLLENGVNPNATTYSGATSLMYASQNGHLEIVNLLLQFGANVNIKPTDGNTALHAASRSNNDSIAEILILKGAQVNAINNSGVSPLQISAGYGYEFLTKLLIFYGAQIDAQDNKGNTPLMSAVIYGSGRTSQILLANGALPNKADFEGNTPIILAAQFNDTLLFNLLIEYGADPFHKNHKGINSLALAIKNNSNQIAKKLIDLGAAKEPLANSKSYLQLAILSGNRSIIPIIREHSKRKYLPQFARVGIFTSTFQNLNDFYWGGGLSLFEMNYGVQLSSSFASRIVSKPILLDMDNEYYQFYEYRRFISLSGQKMFEINSISSDYKYGVTIGLNYLFSWANYNYHDAKTKPYSYSGISPSAGLYLKLKNVRIDITTQTYNLLKNRNQIFWVGFNLGTEIDFSKPKIPSKKIKFL